MPRRAQALSILRCLSLSTQPLWNSNLSFFHQISYQAYHACQLPASNLGNFFKRFVLPASKRQSIFRRPRLFSPVGGARAARLYRISPARPKWTGRTTRFYVSAESGDTQQLSQRCRAPTALDPPKKLSCIHDVSRNALLFAHLPPPFANVVPQLRIGTRGYAFLAPARKICWHVSRLGHR